MATYQITAPDGNKYRLTGPDNASQEDLINALLTQNPTAGQPPTPPKEGIMAALTGGAKRFGSTIETGLESLIDPELAAKRGAARGEEISQQFAPGASLEKVKQAYEEKGLFPAAYEAISQVPSALAEQFPNIASSIGAARVGAMAGSPFGPAGAVAGGIGGAFVPSLMQLYGSGLERQAQEGVPEISRAKALGTAIPGAAAEVASTFIPLGRNLIGKLLGPEAEKALARGTNQSIEAAAKETLATSLTKGAGVGALVEIPTEVTQQMLERLQAGLPLTTPDALAEYGESAYGAALVGTPFGAAARGLGRPAAREAYTNQLQLEQIKAEQQRQKDAEAALQRAQAERTKTQEELGVPKMLALPAPAKPYEEPKNPLIDPVGRVTEDELGKAIGNNTVVNYLNRYRKDNNLPKLKSYSIEDIKDAMTAQNPEGEEGALNAILAYKTNYQNQSYTPDDIQSIAVAKNVATDTKGFSDFLTRATGKADLNTMTQPELHSVATALDALPRTGKEEQLVLPEGSNATRFTQDQYNTGLTTALGTIKPGKPVSLEQALKAVQAQTGLETDRDAESLLRTAVINDDLTIERGTGYQAVSPTGAVLGTYGTEAEAKRMHRRAEIKPVETELVTPRIEEAVRPEATLPEGYQIQKETTVGSEAPAAYVIREDGSQKNASQTFSEEADAKERLNILARKREANAAAEEAAADRVRQDLEKRQAAIAQMEADGKTGTPEHTKAVYAFQAANVAGSQKITDYLDKAEALRTPLKIVPLGKKSTKAEKHTVIKNGKVVASFDTNDKAQAHVLSLLDDKDLGSIAERGGVMGKRASVELDMRQRPGVRGGTTEGLEKAGVRTPEVEAKLKELEKKLKPMLDKFGLGDVGLNVVRAIENDADGAWGGLNNLIRIAFNADNPIKTMRHEALHALFDLGFFTPQQWEALKREAKKTWVDKYLKNVPFNETMSRFDAYTEMGLSDEAILEEAIADAFGDWEGGAKPPPGMMAALFKRLQQFFSALRQALTGAGFESADEIFGKIERGELKPTVPTPTKIDSKMSLRQTNYNKDANRLEVSTARPTAVRPLPGEIAPRDPIKDFYVIDSEDIMSVPAHMASAHNAISAYNWFPISEDPNATVRAMKDTIVDNLVWLYNLTPEDIRNRAKLWYNGANRIAKDWSKIYHYNVRQMAGVLAVLSPQKDWFMNTTLGERVVHVYTQHQNTAWSPDMTAWAESYVKASRDIETRDKRQVVLDAAKRLQGTKLKDMSLEDMAYFTRIYDETYHSRKYRVITPEGMFGDYVTVNEEVGEDEDEAGGQGDVAWGTYDSIQKAISIMQDGSHENISEQLGDEHKVRNFYNNIVDPDSASGSVTIDTHAVAAAAFKALSGASLEVLHNFGTTPKGLVSAGGSAMTGASGTYGFIADAYREAAAMVGVLPREMQSITWEAIRSIFPAAWKSQNAGQVNAIYDRFKAGEITLKQARDEVLKISGGIKKFAWENDKSGVFPSAGATSFDTAKQEPRVLEPYQIREKLKINLSAAPSTDENAEVIPGIQYLFGKARNNDMAAYTLLQEVASDNARHLLSGIENVKITTVPASGLFFEQFEPSVNLTVAFDYGDKPAVLPALKRFASNFKQKQIHVRQVSKLDVETEYDDGSYNTPVFTFKLEDSFSRDEIQQIVRASGLPGITFTDNQVVAYFMRGKKSETAEEFYGQIEKLAEQLGGFASTIDATVERLWVYGSGFGATQGYSSIKGDVRPGAGVTVQTAKRVAAYLNNVRDNKIKTFENADITDEQANKQNAIGDMYDKLPIDDMGRPIVRQAYEALAKALLEQYRALPITVSWSKKKNKKGQPVDAYGSDSAEMRKDILNNNRLQILPTTPESFGPEGYDFSDHPLLQETGLTLDGRPLLYNDLLRAVHDYYAHGMTEVGFGPKGEEAAWKNHMSITQDPLARWALTMETRAQNSYVNFRSGLDRNKVPLKKRGFAEQKAALLPVQVALTGNASVDAPMKEFIKTLSKDERLGSAGDIKLAPGQKFSLRAPDTKEFKQWFKDSKVVDKDGNPLVVYHATPKDFMFFDPRKLTKNTKHPTARLGFFTAVNPESTVEFISATKGIAKGMYEEGANIMPLYASIQNPAVIPSGQFVMQSMALQNMKKKDADKFIDDYLQSLRDEGHDGILIEADKTGRGFAGGNEFTSDNWVVLDASQLKSAIGNVGSYGQRVPTAEELKKLKIPVKKAAELQEKGDVRFSLRTYFPTAEEAEQAAYKKAAPTTPEFKRFFGASKVKEEGRPQVMYHGSPNIFDVFRENKPIFISADANEAQAFAKRFGVTSEGIKNTDVNIYPLWVRAETPFDYENEVHVNKLMESLGSQLSMNDYIQMEKEVKKGNWAKIEDPRTLAMLKKMGFDSFYVKEYGAKNLGVFSANQVKSVTGNIGEFGENKDIRYSLPTFSAAAVARRDETTTRRENKGVIASILESFAPESMANLRAAFIHRYNQLGVYDKMLAEKMGGKVLLADVSAEAAANMSDLSSSITYSAFGIGNRKGGVPVYKNGATTIDNSVKGPLEILAPLAQFNDPVAYQDYQYWAGVKRGKRFMADGREKNFDEKDIALSEEIRKAYLKKGVNFNTIQTEMNKFNDGLVNYMIATGVISAERGAEFKKHMDYIPFFRQVNGDTTVGPKIFNSISGVKPPKKLKGSEAPLTDYLESIVRNTQAAINAGMKNVAAQRAVNVAMQLGPKVGAQRLNVIDNGPDTVQVLENGKQVSYRVADQLFINAVKSLNMSEMPFLGFLSGPANLLRNLVTKDPGFMLANMARDSLSAWTTSGVNITPIASTAANFAKALSGRSATYNALLNGGILGGYEFSTGLLNSANVLEKDLAKKYGAKGAAAPLGVFTGIWDALEKGTEASDAATRMAVYDRVLADTGSETEALYRALEVMNFNRKGSSPVVRILTAAIPFLNARIQGLDVLYRTAFGQNVTANNEAMQKAFFVRGMTLMALSAAYFLAVSDDDEWKKQEQETKDNYWIAPGIGKFPTPFEVGFLFKTVPERIMAYTLKDDTGQDLMNSMRRGLLNTFAFNPIPQVAKPLIEYAANYNFFTGRPIVGQGLEGREVQYQVGPTTTHSMEWLGKQLNLSPIKLEQVYNGYTGTMGMYALTLFDSILNTQAETPNASKRFEQLPVFKRFAADPEARGNITQFYELKRAVDAAVETENYLLRAGDPKEFEEFMERNAGLLATKQYVSNIEKTMKGMREMRKMVDGAQMTADEKRDTLIAIGQAENDLTQNIQTVKKMISEL